MRRIVLFSVFASCAWFQSFSQSKEAGTDLAEIKKYIRNTDTIPVSPKSKDNQAVKLVLKQYNSAIEKLDMTSTEAFFSEDSKIYESGESKGNYEHYMKDYLIPELKKFKSFNFNDYKVEVMLVGNYAFTTETYNYSIVIAKDNTELRSKGVSTTVLKKIKGGWKIMISHSSSGI